MAAYPSSQPLFMISSTTHASHLPGSVWRRAREETRCGRSTARSAARGRSSPERHAPRRTARRRAVARRAVARRDGTALSRIHAMARRRLESAASWGSIPLSGRSAAARVATARCLTTTAATWRRRLGGCGTCRRAATRLPRAVAKTLCSSSVSEPSPTRSGRSALHVRQRQQRSASAAAARHDTARHGAQLTLPLPACLALMGADGARDAHELAAASRRAAKAARDLAPRSGRTPRSA